LQSLDCLVGRHIGLLVQIVCHPAVKSCLQTATIKLSVHRVKDLGPEVAMIPRNPFYDALQ